MRRRLSAPVLVPVTAATRARLDAVWHAARAQEETGLLQWANEFWFEASTGIAPDETWHREAFLVVAPAGKPGEVADAGWVSFAHMRYSRSAVVGIYLLPAYRRAGNGRAAVEALVRAARTRGLHRIEANIDADNRACLRLVARIGGWRRVGVRRQSKWRAGRYVDQVLFELLAPRAPAVQR